MKKKAFQKLTALVAVTAMSASLLTGCGSDASGSNDAATNNAQENWNRGVPLARYSDMGILRN